MHNSVFRDVHPAIEHAFPGDIYAAEVTSLDPVSIYHVANRCAQSVSWRAMSDPQKWDVMMPFLLINGNTSALIEDIYAR